MSWAEAKWVKDNIVKKMNLIPHDMQEFSVRVMSGDTLALRFTEPEDTYIQGNIACITAGVMIRMSTSGYPQTPTDGDLVIDNRQVGKYSSEDYLVTGLTEGTMYYFTAFPYSSRGIYNLTGDEVNRQSAFPSSGETVNVEISVDDPSGFTSITVTCVDETDASETKSISLTASQRTGSFTVPDGHTYHIEYQEAKYYISPTQTTSKVAVISTSSSYQASYRYFVSTISVTYPAGATCTCTCGDEAFTAPNTSGSYTFSVHNVGTWTVATSQGEESCSSEVIISGEQQSKSVLLSFEIYGICRDITSSSPAWARTDRAVGFTATASVGTTAGSSSFDTRYPWSGIVRETISNNVMVKIPKFWFRRYREGNLEYIKIAESAKEGFTLHPAFNRTGTELDHIYVAAYTSHGSSSKTYSQSGQEPVGNLTRAQYRSAAAKNGTGWYVFDISAMSAVQMLILVEFANNNVQTTIGYGRTGGFARDTGGADSVPNLTGCTKAGAGDNPVVWRGIEDLWGNWLEVIDGVSYKEGIYYVCNNPSNFADGTSTNYTSLTYTFAMGGASSNFITQVGLDAGVNEHIMLPSLAGSGSASTFYCDTSYASDTSGYSSSSSRWCLPRYGGGYSSTSTTVQNQPGLFCIYMDFGTSGTNSVTSSRMMYIPS